MTYDSGREICGAFCTKNPHFSTDLTEIWYGYSKWLPIQKMMREGGEGADDSVPM